ncbi:hypothetical protein KEC55_12355 [Burkholderia cepacia]|uniref:hypothetical protein n=1 Tax=Burkholderia cepacia TaxID=292 RepID=UPI00249E65D5|nr:hypothetical protein [Burkholderia cepacia]WGY67633.1 hypothetical protein KEC55_12355 [Burkholderia cepacia]
MHASAVSTRSPPCRFSGIPPVDDAKDRRTDRVFYQNNGQIDVGTVIRDGTTLAITPAGSTAPQNFYILLNSAAVQSVKAALTF